MYFSNSSQRGDRMIKINLVVVGKIKENYFKDGIEEYSKRLSKYCDFKIIEVQEENYSKAGQGEILNVLNKEAERILPNLKGHVICTAIEGKQFSSKELAQKIKGFIDLGKEVTFVIGGSYGICESIKQKSNELISFSKATFPHSMFRLILAEQIYRAFSIINGTPYHK